MLEELVLNLELWEWSLAWVSDTLEKTVEGGWIESGRLLDERVKDRGLLSSQLISPGFWI